MKTQTISIQVNQGLSWDKTIPVLHEVENTNEANAIAYAVSKHFGCSTVRMVYLADNYKQTMADLGDKTLTEYVCRLSGSYIQSKQ